MKLYYYMSVPTLGGEVDVPTQKIRALMIWGRGLPKRQFGVDGVNWHLEPTTFRSKIYVLLTVGWNPRWGQFSNQPGFKVQPVRFSGLVLAGIQLVGQDVDAAVRVLAALPAHDSIVLRAETIRVVQPFIQTIEAQLRL